MWFLKVKTPSLAHPLCQDIFCIYCTSASEQGYSTADHAEKQNSHS